MIFCIDNDYLLTRVLFCFTEEDIDEFNIHVSRYRPEELTKLTKTTKFNKKEIQLIYRGFKQVCNASVFLIFFAFSFRVHHRPLGTSRYTSRYLKPSLSVARAFQSNPPARFSTSLSIKFPDLVLGIDDNIII